MRCRKGVFLGVAVLLGLVSSVALGDWSWQPPLSATVTGPPTHPTAGSLFQYTATSADKDTNDLQQQEYQPTQGYPVEINSGDPWEWWCTSSTPNGEQWQLSAWALPCCDANYMATDSFFFYDFDVDPPAYNPDRNDPDVTASTTIIVDAPAGWICGYVRDAQSHEPVAGATFTIDGGWYWGWPSQNDGYYEIHCVAPGAREVICSAPGYTPSEPETCNVVAGVCLTRNWELTMQQMEPPPDPPPGEPPPGDPPPEGGDPPMP